MAKAVAKRKGSLTIWKATDGLFYWDIKASNGKMMAYNYDVGYPRKFYIFRQLEALGIMLRNVRLTLMED